MKKHIIPDSHYRALTAMRERKIKRFVDELLKYGPVEFNEINKRFIGWFGGEEEFLMIKREMWKYMKKYNISLPEKK